jgi:hypothetical protein
MIGSLQMGKEAAGIRTWRASGPHAPFSARTAP